MRLAFKSLWVNALTLCIFFILGSCSPRTDEASESVFRVNLGTEPPSLDWSRATDHVSFNVVVNLMVGLTEFDRDLRPAPMTQDTFLRTTRDRLDRWGEHLQEMRHRLRAKAPARRREPKNQKRPQPINSP